MTTFGLPNALVADTQQQQNNDALIGGLNQLAQFFFTGAGVPTFTPPGRAIYIRNNGGAGTTLYCWSGAAWAAFA